MSNILFLEAKYNIIYKIKIKKQIKEVKNIKKIIGCPSEAPSG